MISSCLPRSWCADSERQSGRRRPGRWTETSHIDELDNFAEFIYIVNHCHIVYKIILQNWSKFFCNEWYKKKIGSVDSVVEELKQHLKFRGGAGLLGFGEQQTLCTGHSKKNIKMHVTCIKRESKGSPTVKLLIQDIASMHWCIGALMCFHVPSSCQRSYLHIE